MSLSGNLELFPLEEVLRLLARSRQDGCLRVQNSDAGRIYMEGGALSFATVEGEDAIREQVQAAGLATEEALSRLEVSDGSLTEALAPGISSSALTELVREHSVESLYRIRRSGEGHFEFVADARPRYRTGQSFDIETLVAESDRRAAEWADIQTVVPDLSTTWRMVREIDEESVTLSDTAWRFLAALEGACSVENLAGRLGLTTFQTARHMAELSRAKLVEPVTVSEPQPVDFETETPAFESAQPVEDPDRSWWNEENEPTEEAPTPIAGFDAADDLGSETEDIETDDSFLETVFSELEKSEQADASDVGEDDQGFGLLRRRGLGSAFRELADS